MMVIVGKPNEENFIAVYDAFAHVLTAIEKAMQGGAFDFIFKYIDDFSDNLSSSLEAIAKNLPEAFKGVDFSALADSLNGLGDEFKSAFGDIFGNIDLNTVEGLRSAIQTTVNIISNLIKVTTEIVKQFDPIFAAIGEAGKQVGGASDETITASGKLLGAMTVLGNFGTVLGGVLLVINESQSDIGNVFNTLVGGTKVFTNAFQMAFDIAAGTITEGIAIWTQRIAKFLDFLGADDTAKQFYDTSASFKLIADGAKANLLSNAQDMKNGWDQMASGLSLSSTKAGESIRGVGAAVEKPKENIEGLGQSSKTLADVFAAVGQRIDPLTGELLSLENASGRTNDEIQRLVDAANGVGAASVKAGDGFNTLEEAQTALWQQVKNGANVYITAEDGLWKIKNATEGYISATDKAGDASKTAANKAVEGSKEWKTVQEIMLATSKQTNDFTVQMGELANKRYEIDVRAAVDLRSAEIEAETSRINQALQSTVDAADSLRQGATDLWDIFGKKAGFVGGEEIKNAAMNMERRLDEELAVKKQLTDALIEQFKAQTVRLTSGEPLISIDARELAPELELVFDKILKYTQVKATQQGLSLLVGL